MRYAAFIMTFNRPDAVARCIHSLLDQSLPPELILVVDNGNSPATREAVTSMGHSSLRYFAMPDNLGPAGASHFAITTLLELDYPWIYWGDDDDPPKHADTLERLATIAQSNGPRVAAVGEVGQLFDWASGTVVRVADANLSGVVDVDIIGGGQQLLINAEAVRQVGLPRRDFFFGFEEIDFLLRMRFAGWRILVDGNRMHDARVRAGRINLKIRPSSINRPIEALWRNYYSTRNRIVMMRESLKRPGLAIRQSIKEMLKCIAAFRHGYAYGKAFARMSLLGVIHGFTGRMGRRVEPVAKKS